MDVAALEALEGELAVGELDRGAQHVGSLRRVLRMHALLTSSGMGFSTVSHAALTMSRSEHRAGKLLSEALGLAELPGGLEAVEVEPRLWALDLLPDDDVRSAKVVVDEDVPDSDHLGQRIENSDTRWTLDLDDPTAGSTRHPVDVTPVPGAAAADVRACQPRPPSQRLLSGSRPSASTSPSRPDLPAARCCAAAGRLTRQQKARQTTRASTIRRRKRLSCRAPSADRGRMPA